MLVYVLYTCFFANVLAKFDLIQIKPEFEFHDRRGFILVTCNGSAITNRISMFFYYKNKNYTVPRINNVPDVYVGNFTARSSDQKKVMIMCVNSNSEKMIGAKVYTLGYPPSIIPQHFKVNLNCRGYNFHRMVCQLIPRISTLQRLLDFDERNNDQFRANLYFYDSDEEVSPNNSTYDLSNYIPAPTMSFRIVIANMIGKITYNFTFDRVAIQKPYEPIVEIKNINSTFFSFIVDMTDFDIHWVTWTCNSLSPLKNSKGLSFIMIGRKSHTIISDNWPQNSELSCTFAAQLMLGNDTVGQISDTSTQIIRLLEGKPNVGPYSSHRFVDYSSISNKGFLQNISIYYTNVPLIDRNGIINKYRWSCDNCFLKKRNVSGVVQYLSSGSRSLRLDSALIGSRLLLSACTAAGCSDVWTTFQFQSLMDIAPNRRFSVIRHFVNPDNLTLVWNEENNYGNPLYLLVCSKLPTENDCSSIEMVNLTGLNGTKHFQINDSLHWRFTLLPPLKDTNYKLKWVSCFYNSVSPYEAERKLRDWNPDPYVNGKMECNIWKCEFKFNIPLPTCHQFPDLFFYTISVSYESDQGIKALRIPLTSVKPLQLSLRDLMPGWSHYVANISVISLTNSTIPWFQKTMVTDFWCVLYVVIFVIAVMLFIFAILVIFCKLKKQISNKYFKKMFHAKKRDITTKNNCVTALLPSEPITLLNSKPNTFTPVDFSASEGSSTSSQDKESTFSTSINGSSHSAVYSEDDLVNISENHSMSYTSRPSPNSDIYSIIAIPSTKNDNIKETPIIFTNAVSVIT